MLGEVLLVAGVSETPGPLWSSGVLSGFIFSFHDFGPVHAVVDLGGGRLLHLFLSTNHVG